MGALRLELSGNCGPVCTGNVSLSAKRFGANSGRVTWCTLIAVPIFNVVVALVVQGAMR